MTPAMQTQLQRIAALAHYGRDSAAVAAFDQLPDSTVDNDVRECVFAPLCGAVDYHKALAWIEQMPSALSSQPRWVYWRARSVRLRPVARPLRLFMSSWRDSGLLRIPGRRPAAPWLRVERKASLDDKTMQSTLAAQPVSSVRGRFLIPTWTTTRVWSGLLHC